MKTPTEQIKEIELKLQEHNKLMFNSTMNSDHTDLLVTYAKLETKLKVLKEWEAREKEILEIIEKYRNVCLDKKIIEELKNKIKGAGK